jgi:uncharacterized membrane protein YkoI
MVYSWDMSNNVPIVRFLRENVMYGKLCSVAVGLLFVLGAAAWANEKVAESQVPKVVMDAVRTAVPEAKFISGEMDEHHDRQIYKLNVKDKDGGVIHIRVTPEGKVTRLLPGFQWENSLTMDQVPQEVKDAVAKSRPNAKILEVDIGHHHDLLVYEVDIAEGENVETLDISSKGEIMKLERKD